MAGLQDWEDAAQLDRSARSHGLSVRSSIDCLIAAVALRTGNAIVAVDRDFQALSRICDLALVEHDQPSAPPWVVSRGRHAICAGCPHPHESGRSASEAVPTVIDMDDLELQLPIPPPWSGPVPMEWDFGTEEGRRRRSRHRLAVLNDACPECLDPPGSPSLREFLRDLSRPRPFANDRPRPGSLVTPEGELASFMHGELRVEDREAFVAWASSALTRIGDAFAHVVAVEAAPWVRALLWFGEDDRLHLEAPSLDRYLHVEFTLERLWPPVFRGPRLLSRLDDRLDAPYRPEWPAPPAEASVFTRLRPIATLETDHIAG